MEVHDLEIIRSRREDNFNRGGHYEAEIELVDPNNERKALAQTLSLDTCKERIPDNQNKPSSRAMVTCSMINWAINQRRRGNNMGVASRLMPFGNYTYNMGFESGSSEWRKFVGDDASIHSDPEFRLPLCRPIATL